MLVLILMSYNRVCVYLLAINVLRLLMCIKADSEGGEYNIEWRYGE